MPDKFDAIVVGARCAGAATAMLLARQGHRVLVLDQASFPSDKRLSTHLIWHAGVDLLHKWGLLDTLLATNCPALTDFMLDMGELVLHGRPPGTQAGMAVAPRRLALDQVLLNAARAAGAQVREGVTFDDVVRCGKQVTGVRGRLQDGAAFEAHASVVIGADGSHSHVARAVAAPAEHAFPKEAGSFNMYSYFSGLPLNAVCFYSRPERMAYAWQTNEGLALVGIIQPGHAPRPAGPDAEAHVMAELGTLAPALAERLHQARRVDDWLGGAIATFCRQAAGPGWCLVGDAGLTIDPITAAGITNALRDAETVAELVHQGLTGPGSSVDEALASYQARRDAVSVPLHLFAQDMARLAPPTDDVMRLFGALAGQQAQIDRYFGVFGQTVPPADFFSPENVAQILAGTGT